MQANAVFTSRSSKVFACFMAPKTTRFVRVTIFPVVLKSSGIRTPKRYQFVQRVRGKPHRIAISCGLWMRAASAVVASPVDAFRYACSVHSAQTFRAHRWASSWAAELPKLAIEVSPVKFGGDEAMIAVEQQCASAAAGAAWMPIHVMARGGFQTHHLAPSWVADLVNTRDQNRRIVRAGCQRGCRMIKGSQAACGWPLRGDSRCVSHLKKQITAEYCAALKPWCRVTKPL